MIISLSISTAVGFYIFKVFFFFVDEWPCHREVLMPWVSVLVWYTQWVVHQQLLVFVSSRAGSPNTYSVGLVHTASLASRASHFRKSSRLIQYLLGIHFWFLSNASSVCQNIWLIFHKTSLKIVSLCNRG